MLSSLHLKEISVYIMKRFYKGHIKYQLQEDFSPIAELRSKKKLLTMLNTFTSPAIFYRF